MPKILERKNLDERCPDCSSRLVRVRERWEDCAAETPFGFVEYNYCNNCGYELILRNEVEIDKKIPYVRHQKAR